MIIHFEKKVAATVALQAQAKVIIIVAIMTIVHISSQFWVAQQSMRYSII